MRDDIKMDFLTGSGEWWKITCLDCLHLNNILVWAIYVKNIFELLEILIKVKIAEWAKIISNM